jgi:hypothetical protein
MLSGLEEKTDEVVFRLNLQLAFLNQVDDGLPRFNRDVFRFENGKRCLHPDYPPLTKELDFVEVHFEQLTVQLLSQTQIAISIGNSKALGQNRAC